MNRLFAVLTFAVLVFAALPALPLPAPAAPGARPTPPLGWVFQMHRDKDDAPLTNVFLRVGGKQLPVMRGAQEQFDRVAKADYKDRGIPASALAACSGWWAGAGDCLYVIRRGRSLVVYRKEMDEQAPDLPWKRLKVIPLH